MTDTINTQAPMEKENQLLRELNSVLMTAIERESDEEVARACLKAAERLTGSDFGWIGEINGEGTLDTIALNDPGWTSCRMEGRELASLIKGMPIRGIWAGALEKGRTRIINNPKDHPDSVGLPEGHPEIHSFLGAPLKRMGRTIGLIALANKPGGYDREDAGVIERLCAAFVEALQRKRAEEELKRRRRRLEEIVQERTLDIEREKRFSESTIESLPGIFYLFDEEGKFLRWNQNFQARAGLSREEMARANLLLFFEGEDKNRMAAAIQEALEGGYAKVEAVMQGSSSEAPYLFTLKRSVIEERTFLVGMGIDITDRIEAEQELGKTTDSLRERVKELQCLYGVSRLTEKSSSLDEILEGMVNLIPDGWQYPEFTCARVVLGEMEFRDRNYQRPLESQVENIAVNNGKSGFIEVGYKKKTRMLDEGPFLSEERDLIKAIADWLSGAIERLEANEALKKHALALERANAELERFTYISSHHMREPLRKIINFSELLQDRYNERLDGDANRYMRYMVDGALRMGSLIDDLLVFTRLDRTEPELETIDMNVLVNEVVESLEKDLMALKGAVTVGDLPELEVDPAELKRVFRRLLDNAIRYHKDEPPIIRVGATEANGCWVFSVSDNGIGIDPEFTEKIFGVFERLHTPETYPGTGMGLALCKKIVERHGGGVWVESEKGVGSVFYFTISSR